jgi:hypothetical protein
MPSTSISPSFPRVLEASINTKLKGLSGGHSATCLRLARNSSRTAVSSSANSRWLRLVTARNSRYRDTIPAALVSHEAYGRAAPAPDQLRRAATKRRPTSRTRAPLQPQATLRSASGRTGSTHLRVALLRATSAPDYSRRSIWPTAAAWWAKSNGKPRYPEGQRITAHIGAWLARAVSYASLDDPVPLHTREGAGSKPAAPIRRPAALERVPAFQARP